MTHFSVLFVCMGNICRSPTAHGVFRHKVREQGLSEAVEVDSAATHNFHPNSPPDERSQAHAAKRGYDLSDLRARQIKAADFEEFDLILVMDHDNLTLVQQEYGDRAFATYPPLCSYCGFGIPAILEVARMDQTWLHFPIAAPAQCESFQQQTFDALVHRFL